MSEEYVLDFLLDFNGVGLELYQVADIDQCLEGVLLYLFLGSVGGYELGSLRLACLDVGAYCLVEHGQLLPSLVHHLVGTLVSSSDHWLRLL